MGKEDDKVNPDPMPPVKNEKMLVVGIGASAGGVQALKAFFSQVPKDSGNVYVVILHLSPDYESQLAAVLQSTAQIPVRQVRDRRTKIGPNCVYVIPPNRGLTIDDGFISAKAIASTEERRAPVDMFFRELAGAHRNRAVGVILTGTGPNGSMGIKRIKEMGGIIVVQDPREAEYSDMPQNSIATGLVDYILPLEKIPAKINEYKSRLGSATVSEADEPPGDFDERELAQLFVLLRTRTGNDFSHYKRATVLRRIGRRMNVNEKETLSEYVGFLRNNPVETEALLKDLLISVTNFFRDPKAWKYLKHDIIPKVTENKGSRDVVRIWIPGCATGEEAYSMAILFAEEFQDRLDVPGIQIFATDIDEDAIARARSAVYSEADVADVSPERLKQFFVKESDSYRVRRDIREMVLFAVHNVVRDPPFSRLDLVSCRNLLIYLSRPAQVRVLETIHFALRPGGYLFIGSSESADMDEDIFVAVSKDNHVYQSRAIVSRVVVPIPEISPSFFDHQLQKRKDATETEEIKVLERLSYTALHQSLLEAYAAPSIVVNSDYEIVHLSNNAGRYLQMAGGEPSKNLLQIARPELRLEIRSALYQAVQRGVTVTFPGLQVKTQQGDETIDIVARAIVDPNDPNRGFVLVLFEPSKESARPVPETIVADEPVARQLEDELVKTKAELRTTVEQYEIQHEELKASNEELQAINEELRSAAEEIETSKEELQSVNEELSTVNQELKIKIEELSQSNNDLQNLINSTTIATIFLDRRLRVKLFTRTATTIFNLIPTDVGRELSDLKSRLKDLDLVGLAKKVLETLQPYEQEIKAEKNISYLMRVVPYRTGEDKIEGVVLTFLDISSRLKIEEELRQSRSRLAKALNIETVGVVYFDDDMRFVDYNDTFLKMTGYTRDYIRSGRFRWDDLTPLEWRDVTTHAIAELQSTGYSTPYEKEYLRRDGSRFFGLFAAARVGENEIVEYALDISSRKEAEFDLKFKSRMLEAVEQSVIATDLNGKVTYWNSAAERLYGWKAEEAIGRDIVSLNTPQTSVQEANEVMKMLRQGKRWNGDFEVARKDGAVFLAHVYNSPIFDDARNLIGIIGVSTDVGERRRTEAALRDTQDRMRILVESATDYAIFTISEENIVASWSPGAEAIFGYKEEEIVGRSGEILFTNEDREQGVPEKEMKRARQTGKAEDERWHMRKDGSLFYASGVMQPLRSGKSPGYVKILRDQTETIAARDTLRERKTLQRIVRTQEDERKRVSRDLHDHLGQQLTALRLKLEGLKASYGAEPAMMKAIDDTQEMAYQIDRDVSFLTWELRPTALDNLGLRNALANFVGEWSKNYDIQVEFHTSRLRRVRLSPEIEINLYRIAQEALNNILKHAKATKVDVLLEFGKKDVVMVIEDNGIGFNPKLKLKPKGSGMGLGLVGMMERATLLGGTLEIESARHKGTTIIARVPIQKAARAKAKIVKKTEE